MINTQLEDLVKLTLQAADIWIDNERARSGFELELRRLLMQKYCNASTYTITPGTTTGTWNPSITGGVNSNPKQLISGTLIPTITGGVNSNPQQLIIG